MSNYLKPHPTDSKADDLLKRMLPDYKAEIRRSAVKRGREVDFTKLPVVMEAEEYLKRKYALNGIDSEVVEAKRGAQ